MVTFFRCSHGDAFISTITSIALCMGRQCMLCTKYHNYVAEMSGGVAYARYLRPPLYQVEATSLLDIRLLARW